MKSIRENEFTALCSKVAELTDGNDHTNAKLVVAKAFGLAHYVKIFTFCEYMHNSDGCMLDDLGSIRRRSGKNMMIELENHLTAPYFEKLNNSF